MECLVLKIINAKTLNIFFSANLCNQVITSTSGGTIQSANYPSPYSPSRTCFWLLQGSLGSNLQLTVSIKLITFYLFHLLALN